MKPCSRYYLPQLCSAALSDTTFINLLHHYSSSDNKPEVLEVTNITKLHYEYNGTIQCRAFGTPLQTLRWERDGYDYGGNENATIVSYQEDEYHVVTEVRFHPLFDDRGYYTCVAENEFGTDRKSFYNEKGMILGTYQRIGVP